MQKEIDDLKNKIQEVEYTSKMSKQLTDNQNKELKKEIEKIHKQNEILQKENSEISKELKNYQHYTNYAKAAKENLTKKDFSMLETMSRKVEETTNLNENLKHIVTELDQQKRELTAKVDQLEKINLYLMKMSGEVPNELVINEEDENYKEILKYQSNPKMLINTIFKIKQENIQLSQNIQDITIECNQRLREALKQAELKHQQNINGMVSNSSNITNNNK